jgi:hypothetical protein
MLLRLLRAGLFEQKFYGLFEQKNSRFRQKTSSIVLTNALGIVLTILQAQSIRSRLHSVHYSRGKSVHYTTVGPSVVTIATR